MMSMTNDKFATIAMEIQQNIKACKQNKSLRYKYNDSIYNLSSRAQRMAAIERVVTDYMNETSSRPYPAWMELLVDVLLYEELSDTNPYKMSQHAIPFLSERQLELRHSRETGLKAIEERSADGRDCRKPIRRRTYYLNWRTDCDGTRRNEEHMQRHCRDIAAGQVSHIASEPFRLARQQVARWRDTASRFGQSSFL